MRIVAWNLAHQTHERSIPDGFHVVVKALRPDVLILNEYVHGPSRRPMLTRLAEVGLAHVLYSEKLGKNNQVLIASRMQLRPGDLRGPIVTDAALSNFLHVHVDEHSLEIVGLRVPSYEDEASRVVYWEALRELVVSTKARPILYIGDLNADPAQPSRVGGRMLAWFQEQDWTVPSPDGPWSYIPNKGKPTRIDHAVAGPRVQCSNVQYVTELAGVALAAASGTRVSDHAALVLDVAVLPGRD